MSLINKVTKFASSPQGRRLADTAMRKAKDPATKRQIAGLRGKLGQRKRP